MTAPEMQRSWQRTEGFLRDARTHLSQIAEAEYRDDLVQFDEFLENNELGLAFDTLESVARESQWEGLRVFELLALAAANMGMAERQQALDEYITQLRGWVYKTKLTAGDV
jgi:hypothetical protein